MKKSLYLSSLALSLVLGSAVCFAGGFGRTAEGDLLDQTMDFHLENGTFLQALSRLAVEKRVPIGFEPSLTHEEKDGLDIQVHNARLEDVLNLIVQQEPGYRWEVRDGVVNFFPLNSRDEVVETLLGTPIHRFAPKVGLNKFALRDAVIALPEIQNFLKANDINATRPGYFYRQKLPARDVDLSISNTDLRGVLNTIVRNSEHKMWVIVRSGRKREFLNLGF